MKLNCRSDDRIERTKGWRRAAVFGLSANPPTLDHLKMIQHLLGEYDRVHVIVNAQSPLKDAKHLLPGDVRFELLQAMLLAEAVDWSRCRLERLEIDRPAPSFMIDTLNQLISASTETEFTLVMGLDQLHEFTKWHHWQAFARLCRLQVYPRQGIVIAKDRLLELRDAGFEVCMMPDLALSELSSTTLRQYYARIRSEEDKPPPNIHLVVDQLIREKQLYWNRGE